MFYRLALTSLFFFFIFAASFLMFGIVGYIHPCHSLETVGKLFLRLTLPCTEQGQPPPQPTGAGSTRHLCISPRQDFPAVPEVT